MSRVRVHGFSISLDGFGTGVPQTFETPFGHAGERLHEWMTGTANWKGYEEGTVGIANDLASSFGRGIGAHIMGRNMFSPHRGAWEDESWKGWWGDNPPYHCPTFVITHHARPDIKMAGGTTFRFVSGTPSEVLALAREAAGDKDVQVSGGVSTVREFFLEGLIDEAHIVVTPIILGRGERLWDGLENLMDQYEVVETVNMGNTSHLRVARKG